jgi:hypothetical protein
MVRHMQYHYIQRPLGKVEHNPIRNLNKSLDYRNNLDLF